MVDDDWSGYFYWLGEHETGSSCDYMIDTYRDLPCAVVTYIAINFSKVLLYYLTITVSFFTNILIHTHFYTTIS